MVGAASSTTGSTGYIVHNSYIVNDGPVINGWPVITGQLYRASTQVQGPA